MVIHKFNVSRSELCNKLTLKPNSEETLMTNSFELPRSEEFSEEYWHNITTLLETVFCCPDLLVSLPVISLRIQ
jgi:hypothetical protein